MSDRNQRIADAYASGKTLRYIGLREGLSIERVRQLVMRAGIAMRDRGYRSANPQESRSAYWTAKHPLTLYDKG